MINWKKENLDGMTLVYVECDGGYGATFCSIGASLISFRAPDRNGAVADITLGYPKPSMYTERRDFFGVTAGRFANRIALGRFKCEGKEYRLDCNNSPNHLHGGIKGFDALSWQTEVFARPGSVSVVFSLRSPDGDQGYPGNLDVTSQYLIGEDGTLAFEYYAESDRLTPVNLTNHAYWNLAGAGNGTILDHHLQISADQYLEFDQTQIPTGKILSVEGTPFDFRTAKPIGRDFEAVGGYDHCLVIRGSGPDIRPCAVLSDPGSGRRMEVETTQPSLQFYTGNNMNEIPGREGKIYPRYGGVCLETQNYPDAVNHPGFPDPFLKPGESYREKTVHRFSVF